MVYMYVWTFVGVVEIPDLMRVIVLEKVDNSSRVQRSHIDVVVDYDFVVVVVVVVVVVEVVEDVAAAAVSVSAAAAARPGTGDGQPGGDERQPERAAERTKRVDGGHRVRRDHRKHPARQQSAPCSSTNHSGGTSNSVHPPCRKHHMPPPRRSCDVFCKVVFVVALIAILSSVYFRWNSFY